MTHVHEQKLSTFLKAIVSPILSLFIIIMANGFLLTLVPLRAALDGFPPDISGFLAAAFFAGILIGSIQINKVIMGVGHIRAFAFFASMISVLTLLQGLVVNPYAWIAFRFVYGLSIAGIFITIESWLLVKSSIKMRGVALSIYMTVFYAAQSCGQLFIGVFDLKSLTPFCFGVILTSLSVLPMTIIKAQAPIVEEQSVMSPFRLFKSSPLAVVSALVSGFILGPIYGLLPVYAQKMEYTASQISLVMGSIIFGGLVFQWPIGAVSDKIDRRIVIFTCSTLAALLSLALFILPRMDFSPFLLMTIVLGGFCFVIYPLSISHACDYVQPHEIIATTGAILLSYGVGSISGPIFSSYAMRIFGPDAFFAFLFVVSGVLAFIAMLRIIFSKKAPPEEKVPYSNVPQTTPIAYELDPRSDDPLEEQKEKP